MQEEIAEVLDLVEKAQARGTFSLADAIRGKANPSDSVEVYLDDESAYLLTKLNEELVLELDEQKVKELEAKAAELTKKILDSKVTFHMRGIDQAQVEAIENIVKKNHETPDDNWWKEYLCALVAANITSVENANGDVDSHVFTTEEVIEIRNTVSAEAWEKIVATMQKLTLATGYFKGLTDAGFLQKS